MRSFARDLRNGMLRAVCELREDTAIFFSGGVDSCTVLAASLELGRRPFLITFNLGGRDHTDTKAVRHIATTLKLDYAVSEIPRGPDRLERDVRKVIKLTGESKKAHVQCSHPFLYMCDILHSQDRVHAAMGMRAGDLWGLSRHAQMALHANGELAYRKKRTHDVHNTSVSDFTVRRLCAACGVLVRDPWEHEDVVKAMLGASFPTMHKPYQKALAVEAFPEFWSKGAFYREASNLQVGSKLREYHDTLLNSPLNNKGHKRIVGVYNAIGRGEV